MPISRSEGYERSRGKEEPGLAATEGFFRQILDCDLQRIVDADDNYRLGDFRAPSGHTIECKRQPIDPVKYRDNFVEVCEITQNDRHRTGFSDLARLLDLTEDKLAGVIVRRRDRTQEPLGRPAQLSVSILSMVNAVCTVYVNPSTPGHLYVYRSRDLVNAIRGALRFKGMVRGAGMSNQDTCAVFVPPPPARWMSPDGEQWIYRGSGDERAMVSDLRGALAV